jgi:hypothetical protein
VLVKENDTTFDTRHAREIDAHTIRYVRTQPHLVEVLILYPDALTRAYNGECHYHTKEAIFVYFVGARIAFFHNGVKSL